MQLLNRWNSANRTLVPVRCRVVKDLEHFDGSWTVRFPLRYGSEGSHGHVALDVGKCVVKWIVMLLGVYLMFAIAGLMDDIALKVYDAFAYHVTQANFNHRVKTVSLWSLQMTASAVLAALRNVVDPVSVQVRDLYQDAAAVLDVGATGDLGAPVPT
jgi:mitochondrial distribution and morphology protein 31